MSLMRIDERERVFSTLMSWSNQNKSCMELMRAEKPEFVREFSQPLYPSQTRTRVAWELRVDKREFI